MNLFPTDRRANAPAFKGFGAAAILCLVLLALFTTVQLTHQHLQPTDADHCALCIVMHSAAPVAAAALLVVLIRFERLTPAVELRPLVSRRFYRLTTRPPPPAR